MLEQRRIAIPSEDLWPELIDELESFQYSVLDSGTVRSGAPSGQHDDCVIALALAAWQVRDLSSPNFTVAWLEDGEIIMRSLIEDDDDDEVNVTPQPAFSTDDDDADAED
jgi:hypothetical protein